MVSEEKNPEQILIEQLDKQIMNRNDISFAAIRINDFPYPLTDAEEELMQQYRNPKRQQEYRAGRWAAKCAVAALLPGSGTRQVEILRTPGGAPYVKELPELSVSISHSAAVAVAVAAFFPVGIDIEQNEARPQALINQFYSSTECACFKRLQGEELVINQNLAWTYKEAVAKLVKKGGTLDFRKICSVNRSFPAGISLTRLRVYSFAAAGYALTLVCSPARRRDYGRKEFPLCR